MTDIIFQNPPTTNNNGRRDWRAIADTLRARPGEWALVAPQSFVATVTQIKKGLYAGMEAGHFEARSVGQNNGRADIYARYVGPTSN